ncbi:MAG: hypothetical protein WCA20_10445 [Candidatus Sulfotelmatobacter sp.]
MKKVARMLRAHEELLLNWFRAKAEISSGAVAPLSEDDYEKLKEALHALAAMIPAPASELSDFPSTALVFSVLRGRTSMNRFFLERG